MMISQGTGQVGQAALAAFTKIRACSEVIRLRHKRKVLATLQVS